MADEKNAPGRRSSGSGSTTARASLSPLRLRPLARASTIAEVTSPLYHRRDSFMTQDSMEQSSMRSSRESLNLTRGEAKRLPNQDDSSHWHSAPLALALLPAVGGLLFTNGSAIITDVTLLVFAAIFLNWSVRLPWDMYRAAQSIQVEEPISPTDYEQNDTITEEDGEAKEGEAKQGEKPKAASPDPLPNPSSKQKSAASELRILELVSLLFCFASPFLGAFLLHTIRNQLSRPSEGLVSNYNLTIFLLGSELRPISHLIKLLQSRTLHLQRQVHTLPFPSSPLNSPTLTDLATRLDELESHIASKSTPFSQPSPHQIQTQNPNPPPSQLQPQSQPQPTTHLPNDMRKTLQPEIDALNRAVRRYEKRATLQTMQTESRLQDLEARMTDALTLAAAAERSGLKARRGSASILLDWVCNLIVVPVQGLWVLVSLPPKLARKTLASLEGFVGRKVGRRIARGKGGGRGGNGNGSGNGNGVLVGGGGGMGRGVGIMGRGGKKAF